LTAARSLDCPVIGTFHMSARVSPAYEVFSRALAPYADRLDGRIAVSRAARIFAQKYFPGESVLVPNGVYCERFEAPAEHPASAADRSAESDERIGRLNDGRINFLYVGRLDVPKKVPWLISAFKRAHRRNHHCRLVIIGKGLTEPACRLAAYSLPRDSVVFAGSVDPSRLPSYYLSSHIFCSVPSGSESFGIVLLEAMAAGKPVIGTSIEGYSEIVRDGIDGILIRPGDTEALVDAMTRLAVDEAARLAMGCSGRVRAREFDWSHIAGCIGQVYCDLRSQPVFRGTHETAGRKNIRLR
jgi:phosphatidylinositol alpha-mannosyltransferase